MWMDLVKNVRSQASSYMHWMPHIVSRPQYALCMILSPIEGGRLVAARQRCKDNYEPVVHCGEAGLQQSQMGRGRGVGKSMPTYLRFLGRSKGL